MSNKIFLLTAVCYVCFAWRLELGLLFIHLQPPITGKGSWGLYHDPRAVGPIESEPRSLT